MYDRGLPLDIDATRIYAPPQAVGKVSQMQLASSIMYIYNHNILKSYRLS